MKIYQLKEKKEALEGLVEHINELLEVLSPGIGGISLERIRELLENPYLDVFLLEIDGRVAGMASLHYMETLVKKSAWVEDVVVHPAHQGKGLGKKIMKHVIREAGKKGVKHLDLTSNPKRVAANKLYKKFKFKPRETNVYRLKVKKKSKNAR